MADVKPVITYSPEDDKWAIRQKMWDHIEAKDLANFPRPVHNRIPNVKDANIAADQAKGLEVFKKARTVKVNPDKPQEQARFNVLEEQKNLLVPTPRLREGLFNKINPPPNYTKDDLRICSTSQGVKEFSAPVDLDSKIKIDLIVLGSVAVSSKGLRIGKGEGFADLEYGMMRCLGAVDEDTPVITTVHDCQVMDDLPEDMFGTHDVPVDWIVTPTRVIQCEKKSKPSGIFWSILTKQKLKQVPILKKLREREREAGADVRIKSDLDRAEATTEGSDDEHHEEGSGDRPRVQRRNKMRQRRLSQSNAIFVGRFPRFLRASDFKAKVKESCEPIQVIWRGRNGYAFLLFESQEKCDEALKMLQGLAFNGKPVKVEMAVDKSPTNGPSDPHSEDSGNETRGQERGRRNPRRMRRGGGGGAPPRGGGGRSRRRVDTSDQEEYHNAEDGEGQRGRYRGRVDPSLCVFMGSLPRTVRVSEFKAKVRETEVNPIRVVWRGRNRYALLQFVSTEEAAAALKALNGFEINGKELSVQESTGESSRRREDDEDDESGEENRRPPPPRRGGRGGRRGAPGGRGGRGGRGGAGMRRPPRYERRSQGGESSDQDEGQGDMARPRRSRRPRPPLTSVFVGNLPRKLRISEFKSKVRESDVNPLRVQWRGNQGHAFLQFDAEDKADECIKLLQGLTINERSLTVEMSTRGRKHLDSEGGEITADNAETSA